MSVNKRFASVDALRGLTVAAMLLVNNPGSWSFVYAPLEHSEWHGWTPTDLIFPFFLFIVGVSIALAFGARIESGAPTAAMARTVIKRACRIIVLGLVLHGLAWWLMHKPEFRIPGVLQRIGLCFAFVGLVSIYLRPRAQWLLLAALLIGYACLLTWGGSLEKVGNIASRWDGVLFGRFGYEWVAATGVGHDPEGLVSTLGALSTALLGLLAGQLLRRDQIFNLIALGLGCAMLGMVWAEWLPLNKQLWTSSFVLWTGGLGALALGLAHQLIDKAGWPAVGRSFGVNAIAAYAGAWMCTVVLEGFGLMKPLYAGAFGWLEPMVGPFGQSLAFALAFVGVWALIVRVLERRGISIKV
ncbi:acyltransferase family protein [Roseateles oligotrophus]|uniref:Heparan-alpha-glucosaminide N-acetyltransferase domain-containing protein n=1 Tax=Roseateles oligotrophus TaxID=1769250 RepID=A0ABT2YDQ4_9BURK|nr:heparan-alpha-glucosaminide N-acetyltransferase domain-containing protein [Roseateles oligotrophus]MCV2368154.1 heparan-alpha-glucosaminide N-acetyltransferase domain-containing protein [Roseateles oligotrophus]